MNALSTASWFLQKNPNLKKSGLLESIILHKQLFFAQMIHMALNDNKPLFKDSFYAKNYGPVVETVRKQYNSNFNTLRDAQVPQFSDEAKETLEITNEIYGNLDATELSDLSHDFPCWKNNFKSNVEEYQNIEDLKIPQDDMIMDLPLIKKVINAYQRLKAFDAII